MLHCKSSKVTHIQWCFAFTTLCYSYTQALSYTWTYTSCGMVIIAFHSQNLAAHNVFITEQNICQVADMDIGVSGTSGSTDPLKVRWKAPESLLHGHFSAASDVWSYGITIWEMLNPTSVPYGDCNAEQCLEQITNGFVLAVSPTCPDKVGRIMRACWSQSPTKRPSFLYVSHLLSSHQDSETRTGNALSL